MDINSAKKVIKAACLADDTVIMEGVHGIGKSDIVKQFAKENDYHIEELFLSHQEVADLIGIPHMIEYNGVTVTTWSIPIWLQRMHEANAQGKHCILFLDELNRAPIDVRQSALQLVLERQIHEHKLPTLNGIRSMVVAAINPADDYQVDELDPALLDRFLHITVEPDVKSWLNWARTKNVNRVICDFIAEYPNRLHFTPADGGIGATPRSWSKLGNFIDLQKQIDNDILFQIIKGKIGTEIGAQFFSFLKNYSDVIKVEDIENIVKTESKNTDDIQEIADKIYVLIEGIESIQKTELAEQLADKYMSTPNKDILPFLAYLYSLDVEIAHGFLKMYKANKPEEYRRLADVDDKLNDKKLFKKFVQLIK